MNFAEAILNLRMALRISQQQLATDLDISYATVNRWENGRTVPNKMTMNVIEHYCHSKNMEFNYKPDTMNDTRIPAWQRTKS